jgi:hypothetical protein
MAVDWGEKKVVRTAGLMAPSMVVSKDWTMAAQMVASTDDSKAGHLAACSVYWTADCWGNSRAVSKEYNWGPKRAAWKGSRSVDRWVDATVCRWVERKESCSAVETAKMLVRSKADYSADNWDVRRAASWVALMAVWRVGSWDLWAATRADSWAFRRAVESVESWAALTAGCWVCQWAA